MLNKEFRTDGVSLRVQAWIPFLYTKHLIDEAIKFPLALSENSKLAFVEEVYVPVGFQKVFSNRRVFMFSNTLVEVSGCVAVRCRLCRLHRKQLLDAHGDINLLNESQFRILRKCQGKFDCLVYEMLCIKERNPSLNTQTDSIRAKLFV